jgi:inward rectifier potassium channel
VPDRPRVFDPESRTTELVGRPRATLRDAYHLLLSAPWWVALGFIAGIFLGVNIVFAGLYLVVGGVGGARPGSFADAFFFSVQTLATIGYGVMHPVSRAANVLVTVEALLGLIVTALATGLVFAKFSVMRPRVVFARVAVVTPLEGVPTLMVRVANERGNYIVDATVRLVLMRTERPREGGTLYRMHELPPLRERSLAFARGWVVMHAIGPTSPLYGATPESLRSGDAELLVTLEGTDGTTGQFVHARHSYLDDEILFGRRYSDIMSELPDGRVRLDLRRFHDVEPDGTERAQ